MSFDMFLQAAAAISTVSAEYGVLNRALLAIIGLLVTFSLWFLKQVYHDHKSMKETVASHGQVLAMHGVMYEVWVNELAETLGEEPIAGSPQRRRADILKDILASAVKKRAQAL
ncbi:MAG: hypothetical protein H0W63_04085 [Gemmatimonadaceae bacterium]|nr:hypothetical protein [Gemmatimonadaceae bacterium]